MAGEVSEGEAEPKKVLKLDIPTAGLITVRISSENSREVCGKINQGLRDLESELREQGSNISLPGVPTSYDHGAGKAYYEIPTYGLEELSQRVIEIIESARPLL